MVKEPLTTRTTIPTSMKKKMRSSESPKNTPKKTSTNTSNKKRRSTARLFANKKNISKTLAAKLIDWSDWPRLVLEILLTDWLPLGTIVHME
jgi:hypothetical protein